MENIAGKVIVITGASSGLGEASARLLSAEGAIVVLGARRLERIQALADELIAKGARSMAVATDVTQREQVSALVDAAVQTFGRIDVLINNAGLMPQSPLDRLKVDDWDQMIDVNIKGVLNGCHVAKPYLQSTPNARVINLSSTSAVYGQASLATYSATKFAIRGLTEALNIEWQDDGIRVMDIMPLYVRTAMLKDLNAPSADRLGVQLTPDDVAATVWQAAHFNGSFGKVHWPLNWQAVWMFRFTSMSPDWLARAIARRIAH